MTRGRNVLTITLLALLAIAVAMAAGSLGQTDPPSSGDWVIQDQTYWDSDATLTGNITVNSSGQLELDNMTLTMSSSVDGSLIIFVEEGSSLTMDHVNIRSNSSSTHYWFECRGQVLILNSDVRDVASNTVVWDSWDRIVGGVQVYDSTSVLRNSAFHNSQRINVYVNGATPIIEDCQFYNAEYVRSYNRYAYIYEVTPQAQYYCWYTDASGLYLVDSDVNITRCTFRNNGLLGSANKWYSSTETYNAVATWGRGILAYDSSPNITSCVFNNNGEQPPDRWIGSIRQVFWETFYYYDYEVEGGLVCIGSSARPIVTDSDFLQNDLFGIAGFESGRPEVVERCNFNGNRFIRGNSVFAPSGAIYIEEGSGTIRIANTTVSENLVYANINILGPSVVLYNFTNSNNVVNNAYNIYLGDGTHVITESTLDARTDLQANLYLSYSRGSTPIKVRITNTIMLGGQYGIYVGNYYGANIYMANSSINGATQATFYLQSSNVDCVNCTLSPLRVLGYPYGRGSTVRLLDFLTIAVTWQNDEPVPEAFVQVFNATNEFVFGGITDENGTLGPLIIPYRIIMITGGYNVEFQNSPLNIQSYSSGLESKKEKVSFPTVKKVQIKIFDWVAPQIFVFHPSEDHAQNSVWLEVRGMCTDVGSGIKLTEVSIDEGEWITVGERNQTWDKMLNLTEGVHKITFRATDVADQVQIVVLSNVEIDLTHPYLEVLDPVKDTWSTSAENYTIRGRTKGELRLIVNRQVVPVDQDGFWYTNQEIHSGSNEFSITAVDHVGNTITIVKTIVRDSSVPKLILTSPPEGIWTNISQVEVKGITEIGANIRINGEPVPTFGGRFALNVFLTEGLNSIKVEAIDKASNIMTVIREVHLDSIPPVLRIESPLGNMLTNDPNLVIRGTIDDPSVEAIVINGLLVQIQGLAFYKEFRLDEGLNPIQVEVWDMAINYAARYFMITLDSQSPTMTLIEPELNTVTTEPMVRLRGRVDPAAVLTIRGEPQHKDFDRDEMFRIEDTWRFDAYPLVKGRNIIHLEALDAVGNLATMTIIVDYDLVPPELIIYPMAEDTVSEIIEVRGILLDGDEVKVNGIPVVLNENGEFIESVQLKIGKNGIVAIATDTAGNSVEETINVTRSRVEGPPEGILGAGIGISLVVILVMLIIGLAVVLPGVSSQSMVPEAMLGEPIIISTETEDESPEEPESEPESEPETETEPEAQPPRRPLPPPPPDYEGGQAPPQRPLPPPPPDHDGSEPPSPTPPWR